MMQVESDFTISTLGACTVPTPLRNVLLVDDDERVLFRNSIDALRAQFAAGEDPTSFELAGPRERLFFDPSELSCGIVTCGGLCPGLNDVVRAIVVNLRDNYGVSNVHGFRYGYEGIVEEYGHDPLNLTSGFVNRIHETGGTVLGTSRGNQAADAIVDTLVKRGIDLLFTVGGDGTLRGAHAIAEEARRRKLKIGVIGVPKTIDNDISYIETTFGFETAVAEARNATRAASTEAFGARNGVAVVKLMGRDSGFIACYAALADTHVGVCLVPESPFTLSGVAQIVQERIERDGHAVVVVAEGAGQHLLEVTDERDASGNLRYRDIGPFLCAQIKDRCKAAGIDINLKYIDPSYMIRSLAPNARDAAFCVLLGHAAVHAGMAGKTDMVVGYWKQRFTHVPIPLAVSKRKTVNPRSFLWQGVLTATGQPARWS